MHTRNEKKFKVILKMNNIKFINKANMFLF